MTRQLIISIMLSVVLLGIGLALAGILYATRPEPPAVTPPHPVLTVRAVRITPQTLVEPLEGFGTARADRHARLTAQVAAEVLDIPERIKAGAVVARGERLVQLDDRDYQLQLQRARSELDSERSKLIQLDTEESNLNKLISTASQEVHIADKEYGRLRKLFEDGTSDERELDLKRLEYERTRRILLGYENQLELLPQRRRQSEASVNLKRADVELAQLDVQRCTIRAPFDGQIVDVETEIGERLQISAPILTLLDPDDIEIPIELPVSLRSKVQTGRECTIMLDSRSRQSWSGSVRRISPQVDPLARSFRLYIEVSNSNQRDPMMPGMFIHAYIDGPTLQNVVLVPRGSIRDDMVYLYEHGTATAHPVSIEQYILDHAVVTGLKADDVVITSNLDSLYEGTRVSIGKWEQNGMFLARTGGDQHESAPTQGPPGETQ